MTKFNFKYKEFAKKHFGQLVGWTVIGFHLELEEEDDDVFPCLLMQKGTDYIHVTVSRDEEGNGGGHLFIDQVTKHPKKGWIAK